MFIVLDSIGECERFDADFHIDRPMVRHMLPAAVQVNDGSSQNSHYNHLADSAARR